MKTLPLCVALLSWSCLAAAEKADLVVVSKSESRLYLERAGKRFDSFKVAFGGDSKGHKQREGDERTPEGRYRLLQIAKSRGVSPGGDVMIHGQKNGWGWLAPISQLFDWTDGCVALRNSDMEKVWKAVDIGTPIEIQP